MFGDCGEVADSPHPAARTEVSDIAQIANNARVARIVERGPVHILASMAAQLALFIQLAVTVVTFLRHAS